jgi:uncharacterized RDD family membrane protein YckC
MYILLTLFSSIKLMKETILDAQSPNSAPIDTSIDYPPMPTRVKAFVIDNVAILVLMGVVSTILDSFGDVHTSIKITLFIGILLYDPLLTSFGATLGQLLFAIRVRDARDTNKKINLGYGLLRFLVKVTLGSISLIMMSFTGKRRAIHDMAGNSIVIYK